MSPVVWEVCARNAAYLRSSNSPSQCTANASSDDGSEGGDAPSNQNPISEFTAARLTYEIMTMIGAGGKRKK